jgi:hypothetical protein
MSAKFRNKVGKSKDKELEIGKKVEMEHAGTIKIVAPDADIKTVATLIAKDHLKEIPDYYSRLTKMEKEAELQG